MAERAPVVAHRGVLAALRASAIVIIATGLNDVVAGALPRYEPLYLYLGAIALTVFLDGVLIGLFGALLALGAYSLMFRPADPLLPAGEALAAWIVASVVRWLIRKRRRDPPPEVYLAPAPQMLLPPPAAMPDNNEVLTAIDVLRGELQEAVAELTRMRETRGDTSGLEAALQAARAEVEVYVSERRRMQEYLDRARAGEEAERTRLGELRTHNDELRAQIEALEGAERMARGERDRFRGDAESERARLAAQVDALEHALDAARADREQFEIATREEGATLAGRVTELELALSAARAADAERAAEIEGLHHALDAEHSRAIALSGDVNDERTKIAALLGEVELERGRLIAERALRERLELDASIRDEESQRLRVRIDELEQGLAEASDAAAAEAAELRRSVESEREREAGASAELADLRKKVEEERVRADAAMAEIAELRQSVELERGHAGVAGAEVAELQKSAEIERARSEAAATELAELRKRVDLERARAEAAASEIEELRASADLERGRAEALTEERQRMEAEFDQKLQTIVGHLAADHEADMGKAMEEREAARAEARGASLKIGVVQRKMEEERTAIAARLREADERHKRALEDSSRLLSEMRTAALKEITNLRGRIAQLENAAAKPAPERPRILIVYPDADLRANARGLLERAGYDIVSAADGLEAMRMAIAQKPSVVIADAVMPKMNGRELCQLLKSQEKTSGIRVILLTRAGDDPPRGDFPPDEVLRKPVPLETLKSTLATLLGK